MIKNNQNNNFTLLPLGGAQYQSFQLMLENFSSEQTQDTSSDNTKIQMWKIK